ncbi:hypothetical protein MCOR25_003259 [Pyricularia grisea]|uniref:Uncharacterized protein n=1 Tax=Pyricularia grisea TaxID=148305 RepID=A0A6P8B3E4_PYRGI|nr:uncharacterized protein PgNI_07285 [Pyricularia grisea]KAI6374024.1 hypothetical protein MCOR25_003259 [Pyricularia grisea]TLD09362.1 hypothetical protein PgNI_07285 [Pyricularia grisea]
MAVETTTIVEPKTQLEGVLEDLSLDDKATITNLNNTPKQATESPRKVVHTKIQFYGGPLGVAPEPMIIGGPDDPIKPTPKVYAPVTITDITGKEDEYSLAIHGFQLAKHKSKLEKIEADINNDELVKRVHYPEMREFLEGVLHKVPGLPKPHSIHILTHILRSGPEDGEPDKGPYGPLYTCHVDQSAWAAEGVARRWIKDDVEALLKLPRYQIINMWRPVRPIERDPFAVTDARSISPDDIVRVPLKFADHDAESIEMRANKDQKWYYKDHQTTDEVLLFTQVDTTKRKGWPKCVPHAAFKDPDMDEKNGRPRFSVEVRAMVFYDED